MSSWIKCSDRLPEEHKNVIVCLENGWVGAARRMGHEWYRGLFGGSTIMFSVTHWMPLPEPPEDDSHE